MAKDNKKLIVGGFALVAGYFLYKRMSGTTAEVQTDSAVPETPKQKQVAKKVIKASLPIASYPLMMGTVGQQVLILQGLINRWEVAQGYSTIDEDGVWGQQTNDAIAQIIGYTPVIISESDYDLIMSFANYDDPLGSYAGIKSGKSFPTGEAGYGDGTQHVNVNPNDILQNGGAPATTYNTTYAAPGGSSIMFDAGNTSPFPPGTPGGHVNGWHTSNGYIREDGENRDNYYATVHRRHNGRFFKFSTR